MKKIEQKFVKTDYESNYDMFTIAPHQRNVNNSKVELIMESIMDQSLVETISVTARNGKLEIYNGQHTFHACKRLGFPILYSEFKNVSRKAMILLNSSSTKWSLPSYLNYGLQDNIPEYLFLDKKHKETRLSLSILLQMYGTSKKSFENLGWKATSIDKGQAVLNIVNDFVNEFDLKHTRNVRCIQGIIKVYKTGLYDHERMMKQMRERGYMKFTKQANPLDYAKSIEYIYNFGLPKEKHVKFIK